MKKARRSGSQLAIWVACSLFAASLVWLATTAGDTVPAHFDGSGSVTRTDSTSSFLLSMGLTALALTALFAGARVLLPRLPGGAVNLPSRDAHAYWTAPENRAEFDRRMSEDLEWIGAATLLLLTWFTLVSGTAEVAVSVWALAVPTVAYIAALLGYAVYAVRGGRYRVPR
ncbi:MAG: hypothetical protein WBQ44_07325 [Rhodococcus sp. (in: high G+C Gram-positive bacteria)]